MFYRRSAERGRDRTGNRGAIPLLRSQTNRRKYSLETKGSVRGELRVRRTKHNPGGGGEHFEKKGTKKVR